MILKSKKIEVIVPKDKADDLLEKLQNLQIIEVISCGKTQKENNKEFLKKKENLDSKIADLNFTRTFLNNFKKSSGFLEGFLNLKPKFRLSHLQEFSRDNQINEAIQECASLEQEINSFKSKKQKLESKINILDNFRDLSLSFPEENLNNFYYKAGILDKKKKESFLEILRKEIPVLFVEWSNKKSNLGFGLVYPQSKNKKIKGIFKKFDVKEQEIFWSDCPSKVISNYEKKLGKIKKEVRNREKQAQKLTKFIPKIKALIDFYTWERDKQKSFISGEKTKRYFSISGWVPQNSLSLLEEKVKEITPHFLIKQKEIKKGEKPPVIIENKKASQPFESVTNVYGAPKHSDPDPTPFLAPFFALFFAMALSDAGYGLVLFLGGLVAKKFFKQLSFRKFFNLLIISGFLTIIAGILTGTVFGTEIAANYRILDSVKNPVKTMIVTLVLGTVQIFVGLVIGMIWNIKQSGIKQGISSKGANLVFFLGLGAFVLTNETYFLFGGIITMVFLKILFSVEKKVFLKIGKGIASLYDLVGYFGDIISYSRILALGLATGIIAMVVNVVAFLFKDMIPFEILGWGVAVVILVGGHIFNILINSLGAFIHSARLQFVEFFPKFMEGGGKYLHPLSKQGRFIKIIK